MDIKEIIRSRVSVRTFDPGRTLSDETVGELRAFIGEVASPFGGKYHIELKEFDLKGPQSPGTYGTISGASWYLLLGIHDDDESALAAGYAMERVVLKATSLGLGTCWLALTFKSEDFSRGADMPADVPLRIISPVGYPAGKRRVIESLTRAFAGSAKRKPMDELFSEDEFGHPVSESSPFYEALSMLRLAPSAKNLQPWRALVKGDTVWFYHVDKGATSTLDLGIGLCHFGLTMETDGKRGEWGGCEGAPERKGLVPTVSFRLAK